MAASLQRIEKWVFSSTLQEASWNNTRILPRLEADLIKSFRQENKGSLLTFGSISLVEDLIALQLVDEYYFNVQPLLPGKGDARFFKRLQLAAATPLQFVNSTPLPSGAQVLHYKAVA